MSEGRNLLEVVLNTNIAKKFNEFDASVTKLQTSMELASRSVEKFAAAMAGVSKSFDNTGQMGDVTDKLQTIINSLERLNATSGASGLEQTQKGVVSLGESVGQNINMITQLINVLNKIGSTSSGIDYGKVFVEGMGKSLKQLKDEVDEINDKLFGENAVPLTNRAEQALIDEREILKEIISIRTKSTKSKDESYERAYSQHQKEMTELELKRFKDSEEQRRKDFEDEQRNLQERKKAWEGYFKEQDSAEKKSIDEKKAAEKEIMSLYEQRIKLEAKQKGVLLKYTEEENTKGRASKLTSLRSEYDSLGRSIEQINAKLKAFEANYRVIVAKGERSYANKELELQIRYLEQYQALMMKVSEAEQEENKKMLSMQKSEELQKEMNLLKEYVDLLKKQDELEKKREPLRAKIGTTGLTQEELSYYTALNGLISQNAQRMNELAQVSAAVTSYEAKRVYSGEQAVKEKEEEVRLAETIRKAEDSAAKEKARQEREALELSLKQLETKRKIAEANRYSYSGAVKYSQNTRSLEQEKNAIEALKIARDRLNQSSYDYEIKLKVLNEEIKRHKDNIDRATGATTKFKEENNKLSGTLKEIAGAFGIFIGFQSLANLGRNVAKTTGEFELQHRALQAIIGDMQSANQLWDKTIRLAVRSPYNVKQLVTYTKQLAAYRVETEKLYDTTKMLADISSGLGVDMQRLILAYGQVKAANYLRGQELRQFSEAGINILGELAKYFTELKGQAISTGDVFEMVSKRMVKFEDVAEVLKRMTEEGGAFYQMQEIQAETLSGMYANLKDRIDIMLNSIGTETRGVFVNIIKFATFLIEHWQSLSNMLTAGLIVWAAYKAEVWRAASAKGAFTANTIAATAAEGGFIGMLAKSKIALKSFAASIKTIFTTGLGWTGIALAAITTIINVIIQHNRKIDEAKKKYDELNQGVYKNGIVGFNKLSSAIEKNNNELKENNRLLEEAKRAGDKEKELKLQNEINRVQEDNKKIVEEISQNYSELSDNISVSVDGLVDIGANAQKLARIKTIETDLTNIFSENAGKKSDIIELTHKLEDAQKGYEVAMNQFNTEYKIWLNEMENRIESISGVSQEYKDKVQSIIDNKTLNNWEKYNKLLETNYDWQSGLGNLIIEMSNNAASSVEKAQGKVENAEKKISEEVGRASEKLSHLYNPATEKETAENAIKEFIKNLGFMKGKVADFLSQMFSEKLGIKVSVTPSDDKKSLQTWQIKINDFIDKTMKDVTFEVSPKITDEQQTQEAYAKFVKGLVDDAQKIIDVWTKIGDETKQDVVTQQQYNNAVAQLPHLQELSRRAGNLDKNKNGKSNPALELLNKQIDAIKRANTEYKKYQELFNDTTAFNKTKEDFKDLFDELNLTPYINSISSFSDKVVKNAFNSDFLKKFVTSAGKQGEIAGAKFKSGFEYEIDKLSFDEALDKANKEITKIFDQYDFGKELEKLGISKDMGKALFNVDSLDFDGMRKALQEIKNEVFDRQGDDEDFDGKKVKEWVEKQEAKITELENKAQKERLESYINYMRQAMNQRAKIIYDGIKETADIEMTFQKEIEEARMAGDEKRVAELEVLMNRAMQGSKENTEKKLQNQAFEDFKGGELYIRMFEDLDNTSTRVLETMRKRLIEIKESMHELSPTELKAINSEIDKINNQLAQRSSFANLKESLEEAFAVVEKETGKTSTLSKLGDLFITGKTERKIGTEIANNEDEIAEQEALLAAIQAVLQAKENGNEVTLESIGISQEYARYLSMDVNALRQEEATEKANLKTKKDTQRELLNEEATLKKLRNSIKQHANQWKNTTSSIKSLISTVVENIELFGGETNHTTEAWGDLLGAIMDVLGMLPIYVASMAAAGTAVNASLGIIGLIAEAVQLVITLVAALVKMDDAAAQDQIDGIQNSVDRLSDAYDRLKDKFDEAWDVNKLKEYRDALEANIKKQMSDYDAMIAVEKTRKNPDEEQIYEWQQAKLDLQKDYEDVIEDFKKEMGGIGASGFKDAAQEFVDAWADAFIETGDGMEGLMEHFDEVLLNLVKKQAMQRVASRYLEGIFKMIDDAIGDNGTISTEQIDAIRQEFEQTVPQLSQSLKALFESLGIFGGEAENQLSGLQKGIQGVTEETAEIIAAYLNSIRFYIIDTNTKIGQLIAAIQDTTGMSNPMLQELRNIKQKTEEIRDFLYQRQEYGDNSLRVFVTNP